MQSIRSPLLALGLASSLGLLAAGAPAVAQAPKPIPSRLPTLPVDQVERGQTGYGLTVFSGTRPERFDVEVIGVLRNTDPRSSYVLARLTGHGLEDSGVAAGMSGSPVFIDDKLVGAVAFAWPFAKEALAGITPIATMRSIAELPSGILQEPMPMAGGGGGAGGVPVPKASDLVPVPKASDLVTGDLPDDYLERTLAMLKPRAGASAPGAAPAIGWVSAGFGDASQALLAASLGTLSAAGGHSDHVDGDLVAGAPVAAVLVDGDLQLAATGTVTERSGSEVLAFGHPFLGLGPLWLPMASAEILTVLPSNYNSFKISNLGPVVGAFEQDSQAGIRGRLGSTAPMIPYTLKIRGLRDADFHMRIAAVPQLVPPLVAAATVGGIDSATFSNGPQGLDLQGVFHLKDWGDLPVRQSFDGPNAANDAAAHLVSFASFLTNNPLERVEVDGIDVTLTQSVRPRTATLIGAHAEHTVVRPGDSVRLNLDFKSYQGETFRRMVDVAIPDDLPAGKLSMLVGDGESADAARLVLEPAEPVTFLQALNLLRSYHSKRDLVVLEVFRDDGLSVAGAALPRLPGSIASIWKAAASDSAQDLQMAVEQVDLESLPFPADGLVRIDLEVRRREPLVATAETGDAAEAPAETGVDVAAPNDDGGGGEPPGGPNENRGAGETGREGAPR